MDAADCEDCNAEAFLTYRAAGLQLSGRIRQRGGIRSLFLLEACERLGRFRTLRSMSGAW